MKAKRILAAALSVCMITAASAVSVMADEPAATITAITSGGVQTPCNDLSTAISTAGNGGTVEIGSGVVELSTNLQVQGISDITITGAGIGKTTIVPANKDDFITGLENNEDDWQHYSLLEFFLQSDTNYKVHLSNLTIDGTGITGVFEYKIWGIIPSKKAINFVPLRLSGNKNSNSPANIELENIEIKRTTGEYNKGCIQIGATDDFWTNVIASNLYIEGNMGQSNYADIDMCSGSTLTIKEGGFNGVILSSDGSSRINIPEVNGYYSSTVASMYTFYTTIPYLLNCYENNQDRIAEYIDLINELTDDDTAILTKMATDLADPSLQLYGLNCNEQRALAVDFNNAIDAIEDMDGVTVTVDKDALETKLESTDWHTWSDDTDTECDVCGATREIEPEYNVTTGTAIAEEGTGDFADTDATGFVTTITNATGIEKIQWKVTSGNETKVTDVFNVAAVESAELKLGIIIRGLNDSSATAEAIINPGEEVVE